MSAKSSWSGSSRLLAVVATGVLIVSAGAAPSRADTAPGRHEVNAGAGTVLDTVTGRTWQRGDSGATHTWDEAKAYCAGVQLAGAGWRLPSIQELQSIVDFTRTSAPTIDTAAFPGTRGDIYWSSTPDALSSSNAWHVNFGWAPSNYGPTSDTHRVRCVR